MHSTTKYLGGHSDVLGGFAATNDAMLAEQLAFFQNVVGAVPGPFDASSCCAASRRSPCAWSATARTPRRIADFLDEAPEIAQVLYPGLPAHPGHAIARAADARLRRHGLVQLVETRGRGGRARRADELWTLAESLGGVESLIEHPSRMTHASTATGPFAAPPNLVRLSVGIESADDLVEDLAQALAATPARA